MKKNVSDLQRKFKNLQLIESLKSNYEHQRSSLLSTLSAEHDHAIAMTELDELRTNFQSRHQIMEKEFSQIGRLMFEGDLKSEELIQRLCHKQNHKDDGQVI